MSFTVKIKYDPYRMKTSIVINDVDISCNPGDYPKIAEYVNQKIPLQNWIDPMKFQQWRGLLWEIIDDTQESKVEFHFTGRKLDFDDFRAAMEYQGNPENSCAKYKVDVSFPDQKQDFCYDDRQILKNVTDAYKLIKSDEFRKILDAKEFAIDKEGDLYKAYEMLPQRYMNAVDGEFRIVFSGVYTCGKSTLINAIIGKDLLPTRDGTCTSKVFEIHHDANVPYARMSCIDENKRVVVKEQEYDQESLRKKFEEIFPRGEDDDALRPSNPPEIDKVVIYTDLNTLYPNAATKQGMKLVIIDTPGTSSGEGNNAVDGKAHYDITKAVIESEKKEIVVFAANASEAQDENILEYLKMVDGNDPHKEYDQRYLFVLNKADTCNFKPDESWDKKLKGAKNYYAGSGNRTISNPRFFPTSAMAAFLVRTGNTGNGTPYSSIREKYYYSNEDSGKLEPAYGRENYYFDEFCSTSQLIKSDIRREIDAIDKSADMPLGKKIQREIELHSGIVSLERAIREYIEKYAFPLKIQDLLQTYETIFSETKQLVDIADGRFQSANKAKGDAQKKRQDEENKEKEERQVKEELDKIHKKISQIKSELDALTIDSKTVSEKTIKDIKRDMNKAISNAQDKAEKNRKDTGVREEIQKTVDDAQEACKNKLINLFMDKRKKAANLEEQVNNYFHEVADQMKFESFKIQNTVAFRTVATDGILRVENYVDDNVPNPAYADDWDIFKPLHKFVRFICGKEYKDKVTRDYGIDLELLNGELTKIRVSFDAAVDDMDKRSQDGLEAAVKDLKDKMDKLNRSIEAHAEQLRRIKDEMYKAAQDRDRNAAIEEEFKKYKALLQQINNYTGFTAECEEG